MATNDAIDAYTCSAADLKSISGVGDKTAEAVIRLRRKALTEVRQVSVEELAAINSNVDWQALVDDGTISIVRESKMVVDTHNVLTTLLDRMADADQRSEGLELKYGGLHSELKKHSAVLDDMSSSQAEFFKSMDSMMRQWSGKTREALAETNERVERLEQLFHATNPRLAKEQYTPPSTVPLTSMDQCPVSSEVKPEVPSPSRERDVVLDNINRTISGTTRDGVYVRPPKQTRNRSRSAARDVSPDPLDGARNRSKSPQGPRMQTFSGDPAGVKFDVFLGKFTRIANRRQWGDGKKLDRFFDCLTDQALEYANRSAVADDYVELVRDMATRFDYREEPLAARQTLASIKQGSETEEEFLQKVQALAYDGYRGERNNDILNRLTTEAFLRGLRNKEAAMDALGRKPRSMQEALKHVKAFAANSKVLGVTKQVTFEQKAVSVAPENSLKELGDTILRGIESLLKTHLDPRSRSPSPFLEQRRYPSPHPTYRDRDPSPSYKYRDDRPIPKYAERGRSPSRGHSDYERGRVPYRYGRSDRDPPRGSYYRSPDRPRFQRSYSPSPKRDFQSRDAYIPDRTWDRREDRYRSPPRDRYPDPERGYRESPRRFHDRGTGQSRRSYDIRSTSPAPNDEKSGDLNSEGLVAAATHN